MKKGLVRTILLKQNCRRFFCAFLVILMVVTILPLNPVVYAASDEFDILREKYKINLTGYDPANPYDSSDPYIRGRINDIARGAKKYWDSMNKTTYTWDDVMISSETNTADKGTIILRLKAMARGWATPGWDYYNDASLLSDIKNGLDWFYTNRYNESVNMADHWWYRTIGIPIDFNNTVLMVYDELTEEQKTNYMNAVGYFSPSVYSLTDAGTPLLGANRLWMCMVVGIRAIIVKDSDKLQEASDGLNDVFNYVSLGTEGGFLTDGTYIQHRYYPYAGGYGVPLFACMAEMLWLLGGTAWDNTAPNRNNVYEWVFDTFEPVMYKGRIFESVKGRDMSRLTQNLITVNFLDGLIKLAEIPSNPHIDTFRSMVKYHLQNGFQDSYFGSCSIWSNLKARSILNDGTIIPKAELTGNYQFYNGDRVVHRTPEWTLDLAMHSYRIRNYECTMGENLRAWYTADGMTYIYQSPSDYGFNYWPTVDPHRMPGTTVDRDTSRADSTGGGTKMPNSWVGGVSLESTYGTAGMDFKQHTYAKDPPSDVNAEAKKSWFMFDDEVVALGSGIKSTSGLGTETVFENRAINSQGNNILTVNGIAKPSSLGWSETMNGVNWIHLDGTGGYVFPGSTQVKGLRERREGEWYDINHLTYDQADDDFNSTALGGVWQWVRENSTKHVLTGGALNITTTVGSINGTTNTTENILLAAAPKFDFYTDTKLTFSPTHQGHKAGLIIYKDDDNYVAISRLRTGTGNVISTESESGGIRTFNHSSDKYGATVYFKIEKRGSDYLLYASNDGVTWGTALRTYTNAMAGTDGTNGGLKMGLMATKGGYASNPEITASFDYHHCTLVRNYMTLWTDHGINPENESYSYIILPGKTAAEVESYSGNQNISILKNDTTVQAVKEDTLGIIGANFWDIGNVSYITSYNPAAVMVKDQNNQLEIAVSDPTHEQQQVIVEFGKYGLSVVSNDPAVTVLQQSPTIKLKVDVSQEPGKTYNATIAYDPLASTSPPEIITTELQPEADSYVRDDIYADTNYGSEALLKVKNTGSIRPDLNMESYMKFDLGTINNAEILSAKLYVYGACQSWSPPVNLNVYGVDDDTWTESGITWNNKPTKGGGLSVLNTTSTMRWQGVDITSYVQSQYAGDKKVSLAITRDKATNEVTNFNSRENTENKPYLRVETIILEEITHSEITQFNPIPDVQAGAAGSTIYADSAEVIAKLPDSVTAVTANDGTVTVPVTTWVDTDGYNPNVAGSYTFTATLGAIPSGYANTGNHTATVEVVVETVVAPVLQSAVAGDGHVNITWSEVAGSTGYVVYASPVSNSYSAPGTTVAGYSYDVTGLTNGTTYYFAVKAVNPGGTSDYSNELSATPQAPINVVQSGNIVTLKNSKIECLGDQPEWVWFKQGSSLKNGILAYWTLNELTTDEEKQAIINANNDSSSSRYKIADVLFFYGDGAVIKGGDGKNEYKVFKEVTTGLWYVQLIKGDLGHYRFVGR